MMYGELAKQNASYQTGHNTGSLRACGYMQNRFDEIVRENPRKKKYTVQEVSSLLSQMRAEWMHHCNTYIQMRISTHTGQTMQAEYIKHTQGI